MLEELEKKIGKVYFDAQKDFEKQSKEYFEKFAKRDEEYHKLVDEGKITEKEYQQWRLNQIGRGERLDKMAAQMAERATKANEVAVAYVNDATPSIYSLNRNHEAYVIEKLGYDMSVGGDFTLLNESSVRRLMITDPDVMPYYPKERAIQRGIDLDYGQKYIKKHVTSGILQGKSVYKIADDLQKDLANRERASAIRTARTAVTSAQNGGRQDTMNAAAKMGIKLRKRWVSAKDMRVRDAHGKADGQTVNTDEPFIVGGEKMMFPGDPSASGWNLYNCRCGMRTVEKEGIEAEKRQVRVRNPETGKNEPVEDMTYEQWAKARGNKAVKVVDEKPKKTNKHFEVLQTDQERTEFIKNQLGVTQETAEKYYMSVAQYGGMNYTRIRRASYEGGSQFDEIVYAGKHTTSYNEMARNIESFIERSPKWEGDLYRGINVPTDTLKAFKNGDVIDMQGVSSWTSDFSIAEAYSYKSNKAKNPRVIFHSNGTNQGTSIKHLAHYDFEDEVLVSSKARWQIEKIEEVEGATHIYVKEL